MKPIFKRSGGTLALTTCLVLVIASRGAFSASEAATMEVEDELALSKFDAQLDATGGKLGLSISDLKRVIASLGEDDESAEAALGSESNGSARHSAKRVKISEYSVGPGENLAVIASRFGVSVETVRAFNDISGKKLRPGTKLKIPNRNGVRVGVKKGETLSQIAKAYGLKLADIVEVNGIEDVRAVRAGQKLFLPGVKAVKSDRKRGERWLLPVAGGRLSSSYGIRRHPISGLKSFHAGIDIAASQGSQIRAIKSGRVVYSGRRGGYGNVVDIRHDDGTISRYAHNQSNLVKSGARVSQGQSIARVGSTGHSTGPHLHLEIFAKGQRKNPATYF